jgi:hypothetical protein
MKVAAKILILAMLIAFGNTYGQSTLAWSRNYDAGLGNYYSGGPEIMAEGENLKVIGRKNTAAAQRLAIVVYNLEGETIHSTVIGNNTNSSVVIDYKFDADGQVYLLTKEKLGFYKSKLLLQKYSASLDLLWTSEMQDAAAVSYLPYSIGLANGCIFVNAYRETHYPEFPTDAIETVSIPSLYGYDTYGNQLWQREFTNDTGFDYFANKILVIGQTAYLLSYNQTLAKVDVNNNFTLLDTVGVYSGINRVHAIANDRLLITAITGEFKFTITDLNGSSLFLREYNTFLPSNVNADEIIGMTQDSDGNIYVTGRHYGHNYGTPAYTNGDILTLKYSPTGSLIWENRYQYGGNNCDIGHTISLKNGKIYVGGYSERFGVQTGYDYVTLKIDAVTGATDQVYRYNGPANGDDAVYAMCVLDNDDYALTGLSYNGSAYDWTTQFFSSGLSVVKNIKKDTEISPNPVAAGSFLTINGSLYDSYTLSSSLGQVVQSGKLLGDSPKIRIANIQTGMYILQLESKTATTCKKVIIE